MAAAHPYLDEHSQRLRNLERSRPNDPGWAYVIEMLTSKHEGLRAGAAKVLGAWGDRRSTERLAGLLKDAFALPYGWGLRGVVINALEKNISAPDVDWVLDLYFSLPGSLGKHEMLRLVLILPADRARDRLVRELSSSDPSNRQAAVKAIGNMAIPDRIKLLKPLQDDPDRSVRESATALSC